ncbi:MAG: methionine synthase [Calditrichaeota bacterium]|nr:methionine synthase [Calditrichota bacterium]MBT7787631.1 methionine synthase [Calditrichota bacterium]
MAINRQEDIKNKALLKQLLQERILATDGSTGTALEWMNPTDEDFGGEEFSGCNEMLNVHAPDMVVQLHRLYIEAGSDLIFTNTFNGSPTVLAEYGIAERSREIACKSAQLANRAVAEYAMDKRVFVTGSMGPGTKPITVTGGITFDEVVEVYRIYASGLLEGGSDILLLETTQDTLNLKAALFGIETAQKDLDREAPVSVSVTIEPNGTMLAGQNIEALYHSICHFDLLSIGLNCATGPAAMTDHLRTLSQISRFPVSAWPNAGLPNTEGKYTDTPEVFSKIIERFANDGFVNIIGGCCGTSNEHISAVCSVIRGIPPRIPVKDGRFPALAGAEAMVVEDDNRPVFVGERTNTIGSRKFKRLVSQEKWDASAEIGRKQVKKSAMVIDLCVANPDRDELEDFTGVLRPLLRKVRVPIMMDTTDPKVVEAGLKNIGGKPAINSVNLEDGGKRLRYVAELARKYGASLVCGVIDEDPEQGMATTVERKLEIAERIHGILTTEFGIPEGDIIFDPLVFPAATGDPAYLGTAEATIQGTKAIKERFPNCLTLLGISNVSFGLPPAGREVVNSVFLYKCAKAGLDLAIVNTEGLKRYPTISDEDRKLAENLLLTGDNKSIMDFTTRFRDVSPQSTEDEWAELTTPEKVSRAVVEANREGLEINLAEMLEKMSPLDLINGPLMAGMDEVGTLFGDNRLIVAEVLESAEVMKAAVDFIRPYFPPGESVAIKGKMLIATVKGDVHDIGKNLVDMILSNNGFEIINLGIKVPPAKLIEAVAEHNPAMIGLSGLLVRSAHQMVATAEDLNAAGIKLPMLVGGAALTKKFVETQIAPAYESPTFYASDAMQGLGLANKIVVPEKLAELITQQQADAVKRTEKAKAVKPAKPQAKKEPVSSVWIESEVPEPPDYEEHILKELPFDEVFDLINPQMLLGKHLGVTKLKARMKDPNDTKLIDLQKRIKTVAAEGRKAGILSPRALYRWFPASPGTDIIKVTVPGSIDTVTFNFPREKGDTGTCAADWLRPPRLGGDSIGLFVTTSGTDTIDRAAEMRAEGRLLDSMILQAVAIELAEATAEWVHIRMRREWGIPDPQDTDLDYQFKTKYRGIRLSFGYPACPDLADQRPLFDLLKPERIGVSLTEGMMMSPESSVSAVVFHHQEGKYYAVR